MNSAGIGARVPAARARHRAQLDAAYRHQRRRLPADARNQASGKAVRNPAHTHPMPINPKLVHVYRLTDPIEGRADGAWVFQYHGESFLTDTTRPHPAP